MLNEVRLLGEGLTPPGLGEGVFLACCDEDEKRRLTERGVLLPLEEGAVGCDGERDHICVGEGATKSSKRPLSPAVSAAAAPPAGDLKGVLYGE